MRVMRNSNAFIFDLEHSFVIARMLLQVFNTFNENRF